MSVDVYCTMRRRSDIIQGKEDLVNKFQNKDFIQFLVTKNYKFKNKEEQDLSQLKNGDIIPVYSKYGDYQDEYLVPNEEIDNDMKYKQCTYNINNSRKFNL